jgi:hypothetical protein
MRTWTFGQNALEFADFYGNMIYIKSPYGPWGDSTLQESPLDLTYGYNNSSHLTIGWYTANASHKYVLMKILMRQVKAKLGQIPILIQCRLNVTLWAQGESVEARVYRLISDWSLDNVTNRYKDKTGLIPWYGDAYMPWWGVDVEDTIIASETWTPNTLGGADKPESINVLPIIEKALRDNTDAMLYLEGKGGNDKDLYFNWRQSEPNPPYLSFTYIYPIEFYAPLESGDIDLLRPMDDTIGNEYFLGAVERGETGQAVKGFVRNYTGATAQIDIWDDFPEVTQPYQSAGTGSGSLDYAEAGEPAVSQKYTVVFYSATQYEVQAEAYREYPTNLHPSINGDAAWRGDINTDFYAPSGGLKIPATGWQPGVSNGDTFEFNVRGNTTDSSWPADSNDQVEMTSDLAGNPDNSNWRPITARRTKSTLTVTIDAATKLIPVKYVDPGDWPVGNKAFIMNETTIDEGVVQSAQAPSIGSPAFTGAGLDDLSASGNYNGNLSTTVRVRIDGTGAPDTFEYSWDGGSIYQPGLIPITGSPQLLGMGVWITFGATTGHTSGDYWDFDIEPFAVELAGLTITSNIYGSGALVATSLPFRDVESVPYSVVTDASGASYVPSSRLYVEDPAQFSDGMELLIEKSGIGLVGETSEVVTIAAGGVNVAGGYLTLTSNLTLDYTTGDFVGATETGHRPFWMRPVATPITVEELKKFRLNAKIF